MMGNQKQGKRTAEEAKFNAPLFLTFDYAQIPSFKEVRGKDWVYYGEKNIYPDYLIELYQRSAKHNAIVNAKVNYTIGGGFAGTNEWVKKVNRYEGLDELTRKLSFDFELFNSFAVEVIYTKKGGSIAEMYHIDTSKIRTNIDETVYYYSDNWLSQTQTLEKTGYKTYKPFDFNDPTGVQLLYFYIKTPRKTGEPNVYPIPEYCGALAAIENDVEINNFHLTNIKTGFSAGTMVNLLNGMPSPEEAKKIEKRFKEKFTGTDRAGALILNFAIDKDHAAEVLHLQPSDIDKQYLQLSERVEQDIFTGHKVTSPMLFGVKTEGQLGGSNEMINAFELFQNTYIANRQKVFENTFNTLAVLNKTPDDLQIKRTSPVGIQIDVSNIIENLSREEIRALISKQMGIELKEEGQQIEQFSKELNLLECFKNHGVSKSEFDILKTKSVKFAIEKDIFENELSEIKFAAAYSTRDLKVLSIIEKDPLISIEDIAKGLDITKSEAKRSVERLERGGAIKKTTSKDEEGNSQTEREITNNGERIIEDEPNSITEISVMYSYEWRRGFSDEDYDSSRPFCQALIDLDKLYKREEIEKISAQVGYNVFLHRGGYYRKPNTDITLPYCRHEWRSNLVVKKKK